MNENDDPNLSKLLQSWEMTADVPAGFERGVWQKIADHNEDQTNPWMSLAGLFLRPQFALPLILVVAFSGIVLGFHKANVTTRAVEARTAQAYLFSIDPVNRHYASLHP